METIKYVKGDPTKRDLIDKYFFGFKRAFPVVEYDDTNMIYFVHNGQVTNARKGSVLYDLVVSIGEEVTLKRENECPFKPFDKVLVRDTLVEAWKIDLFSHIFHTHLNQEYYACLCDTFTYCIPYEGNEDLLGINLNPK